jgi:tetratricopeptide (TPR) repeat protein
MGMSIRKRNNRSLSRRTFLKSMGLAPLVLRSAPLVGSASFPSPTLSAPANDALDSALPLLETRLTPHYPVQSPLAGVLRLVPPGTDEYITEKYAFEIDLLLQQWSRSLQTSSRDSSVLADFLDPSIQASSLRVAAESNLRSHHGIRSSKRTFNAEVIPGRELFLQNIQKWLGQISQVLTAEFEVTGIRQRSVAPLRIDLDIRYNLVASRQNKITGQREQRVGYWQTEWSWNDNPAPGSSNWKATKWKATEEILTTAPLPGFIDVSRNALGAVDSYKSQLLHGSDYWRTVLDGACGVDVYGNNGIAAGDFDNDGFDDLYICQPAGLPNRLYRNRGDGAFEDVTEKAGVAVLDNTACALFADFENKGLQDLLVVCGSGPLLFLNQGNGAFTLKRDAFKFEHPPQGAFTHAAIADYDGDGRLDIYFCLYSYYLGLDQYHYPVPYFDARNGPPNFLFRNEGNATFTDRTAAAGLNAENDRYSFACAWGNSPANTLPDLYVANDFGRANLYRNNGNGTFAAVSSQARVNDPGAGMSAAWSDFDNDGNEDIYVANMWSAAGQRVSTQNIFQEKAPQDIRAHYRRHARGNALYKNHANGAFENISPQAGVEMGRWAWCSDFWDFDHDGYPDLYVANGYISAPDRSDLSSFFWRQVVGNSPNDSTPSSAYEHGWQAINELIRSDVSWSGYERNVLFANNRDGTFSEVSGIVGLDLLEDSRSFALADLDHDGRLEVILKNRNAPQLRILHNAMTEIGDSIAFRLRGTHSNRDAIGTAITLEAGALRQTKYLQAGSGFLAQHSKEIFFGLGKSDAPGTETIKASIHWPSGLKQEFTNLPPNTRIEIEEGTPTFTAKPFAPAPTAYQQPGPPPAVEQLPTQIGSWIIQPLKAPDFSLPNLAGELQQLSALREGLTLLNFWTTTSTSSREQLHIFQRNLSALAASHLAIIAINVDEPGNRQSAKSFARQENLGYPVLFANEEIAGVYNIIYRYLFDRRRDLPIPASFLLDKDGMIVKLYQGQIESQNLLNDIKAIPATTAERIEKALPFAGSLYQGTFQRNDFTYGVAMYQHGYLQQAAESFLQVIAAKPDDPEGYYNLGTLSLQRKDYPQARQYLEQTLKLRPNYPEAWNNLGMLAAQQGHPDEAIQNFQQSLQLRPDFAIALLNLGNVYRRQGAYDKAKAALTRALELQPGDPEINYSLGMFYAQQNQTQPAADYLQKAIALRPGYPEALNNLGVLYVRSQDYAKAEEQFQTCIRLTPAFDQSYLNLARLYTLRHDSDKAREVLQQLLNLQPDNAAAQQALNALQPKP